MGGLSKILKAGVLAVAVACAVLLGAVFPVPPLIVPPNRRRTDRTELVQPAMPGVRLDPGSPRIAAGHLDLR